MTIQYIPRTRTFNDEKFRVNFKIGQAGLTSEVRQLREPYMGEKSADSFDEYSVIFLAEYDGIPIITYRFILAERGAVECEEFYDPSLFKNRRIACSSSRLYSCKQQKPRSGAARSLLQYAMHIALDMGLRLDIANCHTKMVRYYMRRFGYIADLDHPFSHPTLNTPSFPMFIRFHVREGSPFNELFDAYSLTFNPSSECNGSDKLAKKSSSCSS